MMPSDGYGAATDEVAEVIARRGLGGAGPDDVRWIQTHISHVFLVGDRVYKLRKPVRLAFLDFSTLDQRNQDCRLEVALNRRLAPDVYLGVVPMRIVDGIVEVGAVSDEPEDRSAEHAVLMRRLPDGRDALALLEAGRLEADQLERVACLLARFHAQVGLGRPAPWTEKAWRERISKPIFDCLDVLADSSSDEVERLERLRFSIRDVCDRLQPAFERRRLEGRAVEGHGDLHLDHVWFETDVSQPLLVDCLEFDPELRRVDRASEVAFLAMDLAYRGADTLAEMFLSTYARETDDYGLYEVLDLYVAYRALVRAKVAGLASRQTTISSTQRDAASTSALRHLVLAEGALTRRSAARVEVLCGTVGSGKSTVARERARESGRVLLSSDRLRKRLIGLEPAERVDRDVDRGLYAPDRREAVYCEMLERAAPVVASGRSVILDASFTRRVDRERVRRWAEERGLEAQLVEVRCDPEIARARLADRERAGADPSDAGPDFLPISIERFEAPDEWPAERHEVVRTDVGDAP